VPTSAASPLAELGPWDSSQGWRVGGVPLSVQPKKEGKKKKADNEARNRSPVVVHVEQNACIVSRGDPKRRPRDNGGQKVEWNNGSRETKQTR